MKRLLILFLMLLMAAPAFAVDTKITEMTEDTAPTSDDLVATVNSPGGSPASRKATIGNLTKGLTIANFPGSANVVSLLGAASYAAIRTLLDLEAGTDFNAYSAALASLSGLTETNGGIPYGTADNAYAWLAAGTQNYLLQGNGAGAPSWVTNVTLGTVSAGAAGFLVDADGDTTVKSITVTRVAGSASAADFYEVPANGNYKVTLKPADQLTADYVNTLPSVTAPLTATIASGAKALATSEIASGACSAAQTDTATGTATTDIINWTFNADPTSTTGYSASANGMLTIIAYPTSNTANFKVCNNTAAAITPGAITLNWNVVR